jgi:hypothetical protein
MPEAQMAGRTYARWPLAYYLGSAVPLPLGSCCNVANRPAGYAAQITTDYVSLELGAIATGASALSFRSMTMRTSCAREEAAIFSITRAR